MSTVSTQYAWSCFHENQCNIWTNEISNKPKLRTYVTFKQNYKVEDYVISFINRYQRSYLAQLRTGILPLHIETGRWYNVDEQNRLCKVCNTNQIENENHFLFHCKTYDNSRAKFIENVCRVNPNFPTLNDNSKLQFLMSKGIVNVFSKYICEIYNIRKNIIYKDNI